MLERLLQRSSPLLAKGSKIRILHPECVECLEECDAVPAVQELDAEEGI